MLAQKTFDMNILNYRDDAIILKRYKRFLADIKLPNGEIITVHTANTGSMRSCWQTGWRAVISDSQNEKRKYRYSLEMLHNGKSWIGVNTARPNQLVEEHIRKHFLKEFNAFKTLRREVKYGGNSRIDILLEFENNADCYIEIKNVTLKEDKESCAYFPDAVTERGLKHIHELLEMKQKGYRSVLFFLVQREDVDCFRPAYHIHPEYANALKSASENGLEILVYRCSLSPKEIVLDKKLPFDLSDYR